MAQYAYYITLSCFFLFTLVAVNHSHMLGASRFPTTVNSPIVSMNSSFLLFPSGKL